jgi:membrane-associated phospholipid phosphatase
MLSIIEKNKSYLGLYLLFFAALFTYQLSFYQTDALFYFSHHRSGFLNGFFMLITRFGEEFSYLILALWFFYKNERKTILKIIITAVAVLVISTIMKLIFSHPRPVTFLEEHSVLGQINLVNDYILRGMNSFPSGHTMSAFALFSVLAFHFFNQKSWQKGLLIIAILVGVSRVYLVAHFPEDVLLGSATGVFIALGIEYYFTKKMYPNSQKMGLGQVDEIVKQDDVSSEDLKDIEPKLT